MVAAVLFKRGLSHRAKPELGELAQAKDHWYQFATESARDYEKLWTDLRHREALLGSRLESIEASLVTTSGAIDAIRAQADTVLATVKADYVNQVRVLLDNYEERIDGMRASYAASFALKAPVTFWREKQGEHSAAARKQLKGIMAVGSPGVLMLVLLAWQLLGAGEVPSFRGVGVFLVAATMVLWFLRVTVRLYLGERALEADARERVVMAQTYLALLHEGLQTSEAERLVVIQSLFRTAATGVSVEGDSGPSTVLEAVGRLTGGGKGG